MKKSYIGIYDSGIGGLSVVSHLIEAMPEENIVFLADNKHMPYGSKNKEEILSYSLNNVEILQRYPLKAIIIACNTSDSIASEAIREKVSIPVFGVIDPVVDKVCQISRNHRIAIMATQATIKSRQYELRIHQQLPDAQVFPIACPELVPLIEDGKYDLKDTDMKRALSIYLGSLDEKKIDTIVLGCTHYDVLRQNIHAILPDVQIVSSSRCVIGEVKQKLTQEQQLNDSSVPSYHYLTTLMSERFKNTAHMIMPGIEIESI